MTKTKATIESIETLEYVPNAPDILLTLALEDGRRFEFRLNHYDYQLLEPKGGDDLQTDQQNT